MLETGWGPGKRVGSAKLLVIFTAGVLPTCDSLDEPSVKTMSSSLCLLPQTWSLPSYVHGRNPFMPLPLPQLLQSPVQACPCFFPSPVAKGSSTQLEGRQGADSQVVLVSPSPEERGHLNPGPGASYDLC